MMQTRIPNGLGALFGLAQLILYACYYKSTPKTKEGEKDDKKNVEMPLVPSNVDGNISISVER